MNKVCLIIVFNHRFDKNIPVLEKIYKNRFSAVYFLVPFYNGTHPNVIPVYESSHFFQSFFAQGFHQFYKEEFSHYLFIGDDCILNPAINENNLYEKTGLQPGADFIPGLFTLHSISGSGWWHTPKGIEFFTNRKGAEIARELPSREEAMRRFQHHNLEIRPLTGRNIFGDKKISFLRWWQSPIYKQFFLRMKWKEFRKNGKIELPYPVAGSYSDILIVTKDIIAEFCRYCGIMAAAGLFVEIAIPTALVLLSKKIMQEHELRVSGKALWSSDEWEAVEQNYGKSLSRLIKEFPQNQLHYHPIKLSRWKDDL
jgi:hypothetical protein